MVLPMNNKVSVMDRSVRNSSGIGSHGINDLGPQRVRDSSTKSESPSLLSDSSDKVRLNDELLRIIITNNMQNIVTNNKNNTNNTENNNKHIVNHSNSINHKSITNDYKSMKPLVDYLKNGGHIDYLDNGTRRINTIDQPTNALLGEDELKKSMVENLNNYKEMSTMMDSNRVRMFSTYFNYSSIVSHAIKDWFEGKIHGKLGSEQILYDNILLYFAYLFCARNILLTFIEDIELRAWLGEIERIRPYRQLVMVMTIWSVYVVAILRNFRPNPTKKQPLSWLEPFRVFRGESIPRSYGLSEPMLHSWFDYSISSWRFYFGFAITIFMLFVLQTLGLLCRRWNGYHEPDSNKWYNTMLLFWSLVQIGWGFLIVTYVYICIVYFNSLCYYFRIRYEKVNEDIEIIINKRLKANERVALLHHILIEHNSLCLKVSEYNKFWASHLMSTYFFLVAVICFSSFQAFFTTNLIIIRLYMFLTALLAGFIITRISVSAAIMSNRAHHPYGRLIRVTFEKYPVELQIQLRMFIQRTSGPTIGFYCLDVFEITYTTYASILAALGQNFLLIVDFVRSYAEVGKDYEEISFSDLNMLTSSVFNSTLDVLDEMTGTHLSEALYNSTNSFIPF